MTNRVDDCKKKLKGLVESLNRFYLSKRLPWYIIGLGIFFRLYQYLCNRSLWRDEAKLSLLILDSRLSDFLGPVSKPPPPGFLVIEKASTILFGSSEYALRLFPLISGIIALFAFYYVIKRLLDKRIVPVALLLFCCTYSLIYFSTELKQYSSDVAAALILYSLAFYLYERKFDLIGTILIALVGAVFIWFSHPSVFILGGIGLTFTVSSLLKKEWKSFSRVTAASLVWLTSFAAVYFFILRHLTSNELLQSYWSKHHFAPLVPASISDLKWYADNLMGIFENKDLMNLANPILWAVVSLVGCLSLILKNREGLFLLITPIFLTLIASSLHRYPFYGRLLLFITPAIVIFLSVGLWEIFELKRGKPITTVVSTIIGVFLIGLLFFSSFFVGEDYFFKPITREEIKPVLVYIKEHQREGDIVYVYYGAFDQFLYYAKRYDFDINRCYTDAKIRENPPRYSFNLNTILGHERVWILFSHVFDKKKLEEVESIKSVLIEGYGGRVLDFHEEVGSFVYLFEFSNSGK
ncbi:MAG: glycosyltransferase family 39 protein [Deltaproteobacteria bacterium]|uniref:Glycosyltransferase family 39 protein n=1 Tax=Candidatus Zymogenus saltonus TaxID=2844893 RepID=A0A9D8PP62_9DELT|nr:glycosyltransferase family 39 protein [Candidatus Zymogenus saltonus]